MGKSFLTFILVLSAMAVLFLACGDDSSTESNRDTEFAAQIFEASAQLAVQYISGYLEDGVDIFDGGVYNVVDSTEDSTFVYDPNNHWWTYSYSSSVNQGAYSLIYVFRDTVRISANGNYQEEPDDSTDLIEYSAYHKVVYDYAEGIDDSVAYCMSGIYGGTAGDTLLLNGTFIYDQHYNAGSYEFDVQFDGGYSNFHLINEIEPGEYDVLSGDLDADLYLSLSGDTLTEEQLGEFDGNLYVTVYDTMYQAVFVIEGDSYTVYGDTI